MEKHNDLDLKLSMDASIRSPDLTAVMKLLRSGITVNDRNAEDFTPLMIAAGLGQLMIVDALLHAGAAPLIIDPRMGSTALHKAA